MSLVEWFLVAAAAALVLYVLSAGRIARRGDARLWAERALTQRAAILPVDVA